MSSADWLKIIDLLPLLLFFYCPQYLTVLIILLLQIFTFLHYSLSGICVRFFTAYLGILFCLSFSLHKTLNFNIVTCLGSAMTRNCQLWSILAKLITWMILAHKSVFTFPYEFHKLCFLLRFFTCLLENLTLKKHLSKSYICQQMKSCYMLWARWIIWSNIKSFRGNTENIELSPCVVYPICYL